MNTMPDDVEPDTEPIATAAADDVEPEPDAIEPDPLDGAMDTRVAVEVAQSPAGRRLMAGAMAAQTPEVLAADTDLPPLIRFIPNPAIKARVDEALAYAKSITVHQQGAAAIARADAAVGALRNAVNGALEHFEDPVSVVNKEHKRLTSARAEWTDEAAATIKKIGRDMFNEQRRLDDLEAAEKRRLQEIEDQRVRDAAAKEAKHAEASGAPATVVEDLKQQSLTATAPPVAAPSTAPPLRHNSVAGTWKSRLKGTAADAEPNPDMTALTPVQRSHALALLKAILDNKEDLTCIEINWKKLNSQAKADRSALNITGIEAFQDGGVRAKPGRRS